MIDPILMSYFAGFNACCFVLVLKMAYLAYQYNAL